MVAAQLDKSTGGGSNTTQDRERKERTREKERGRGLDKTSTVQQAHPMSGQPAYIFGHHDSRGLANSSWIPSTTQKHAPYHTIMCVTVCRNIPTCKYTIPRTTHVRRKRVTNEYMVGETRLYNTGVFCDDPVCCSHHEPNDSLAPF